MSVELLALAVAGLMLLMWVIVHLVAIIRTLKPPSPPAEDPADSPLNQSAAVLSGMVIGVVTLVFGIDIPKNFISEPTLDLVKYAYVIAYILVGFACWLVWILHGEIRLPVRNLALSLLGIGTAFVTLIVSDMTKKKQTEPTEQVKIVGNLL